jgi:hypothetical protein
MAVASEVEKWRKWRHGATTTRPLMTDDDDGTQEPQEGKL